MAGLRVFVSSTCYDLSLLRAQLRIFINSMGYDPIMSDYEDVLYDPRAHTHTSCVDEVSNCDVLVLIIGSRYGGKSSTEALNRIDFDVLKNDSLNVESLKQKENLSVTQLEVLKAIENTIPIYTFIEKKVYHDHDVYEKNKSNKIAEQIIFPSIEKQETAKYIFNFINFVRMRTKGNNIFTFEKAQDIEETLKKQWSSYFQRLLYEQRFAEAESKRIDILSEQLEDLKTAILSSIDNLDQREIARGIIKFRRLLEFVFALKGIEIDYLKSTNDNWGQLFERAHIIKLVVADEKNSDYNRVMRNKIFLIRDDGTFYESRFSEESINEFSLEWSAFIKMKEKSREIIIDALTEMTRGSYMMLRYNHKKFDMYISEHFSYELEGKNKINSDIET